VSSLGTPIAAMSYLRHDVFQGSIAEETTGVVSETIQDPILMNQNHTTRRVAQQRPRARTIPERKIFRLLLLLFLFLMLSGLKAIPIEAAASDPSEVKAAFVYNFIKFVSWPSETWPPDASGIALCVMGNDPLGSALHSLSGKTANGKMLTVKRVTRREETSDCQILYICRSEAKEMREILRREKTGVLTIGDMKHFASSGGIINFVLTDNRVSFEINTDAATAGGIRISSQLLRLATIVRKDSR